LPRVGEYFESLLSALEGEHDLNAQISIVELLASAHDPRALPVFLRYLQSSTYGLRSWSKWGIRGLNKTSAGRKTLWELYWGHIDPPISLSKDGAQTLHEILEQILQKSK
jgi:hypothetical protein